MTDYVVLDKLKTQVLKSEFGKIKTDEIIITGERLNHIKTRHPQDFELFKEYGANAVTNPDLIIKYCKNDEIVFMVKKLDSTNLEIVLLRTFAAKRNTGKGTPAKIPIAFQTVTFRRYYYEKDADFPGIFLAYIVSFTTLKVSSHSASTGT